MVVSDGLGMRLLILVLAVLTALQIALIGGSAWLRVRDFGVPLRPQLIAQTVATVELLEATPAEARGRVLRAVNSPLLRYRMLREFPAQNPHPESQRGRSSHLARAYAQALAPRTLYVFEHKASAQLALGHAPRGERAGEPAGRPPPRHSRARPAGAFALLVQLEDGAALVMEASPLHRRQLALSLMLVVSSGVGLVLLGGLIWASLATSRPLARMAEGIAAFADDLHAQPLAERGPSPVRRVAAAFNRMQGELRRLLEQRTMTLAAIAHDYRTYLTRLRLRAEFIVDPTQQGKAIADIDEMSSLLDDTLVYARHAQVGAARAQEHAVEVVPLLRELLDAHEEATDAKVTLTLEQPTLERAQVAAARAPLRRALANLVDNAVRYGDGGAHVLVSADREHEDSLCVTVRDEGRGVPPQALGKLTEPFYRVENSRSRETGGAGLGLAITQALVESLGGHLTLRNSAQGGLEARVLLPLLLPAP